MDTMLWEKLGVEVRNRRAELRLSQADVSARGGPSVETVRAIENNRSGRLSLPKRRALEQALEWESGSIDDVLQGGSPTEARAPHGQAPPESGDRFALAKQVLSMKATFAKHQDQIEPAARDALVGEITKSAREAEQAIIALMPWLDDQERGEAIALLGELRAPANE